MSGHSRSGLRRCVELPQSSHYILQDAHAPLACIEGPETATLDANLDSLVNVDVEVEHGIITAIRASSPVNGKLQPSGVAICNLRGSMLWPTFVDLHTHIDKSHTCERSRNPTGSLSGADRSTDADALFWNSEDVYRRMDFSLKAAYAHGTSAVRTHLINMAPVQLELTWPTFAALRKKWAGKVELQGVALVALSFYRDEEAAARLADTVASHGGVLGACVCCAEIGGDPSDDWTTCERDRGALLDRIFSLAKARDVDLDFHADENGNEAAKGLLHISEKAIQHGYEGRVVCGHCCSLASQPPHELERILSTAKRAGVTIVSLPLVNQWTQDRHLEGKRTPRWRGVTLAHEIAAAGIPFAIASDNTRDQFYAYGDLDMMEVFTQGCRISHLDRPYGSWPASVTCIPAAAMNLPGHGRLRVGGAANLVIFKGRKYSELLSRQQFDRVVVRDGAFLDAQPPDYRELDYVPSEFRYAAPRPLTPLPSANLSRLGSFPPNPLDKTASGPFSSFSQDKFRQVVEEEVQRRLETAAGIPRSGGSGRQLRAVVGVLVSLIVLLSALWLLRLRESAPAHGFRSGNLEL